MIINNNNNLNKNKYENTEINIDKRIIPLFSTPVILKKINDQKRNKYNFNVLNPQKKLTFKKTTLNEMLDIYLKGLNIYKSNLNKYLLKNNKLNLILQLKNDDIYKLNARLSNYLYSIDRLIPILKLKSLISKIKLFSPNYLLKPESSLRFIYRLRYITKIIVPAANLIFDKREKKIKRRQINKLITKGKEILIDLNNRINQKKILIKKSQMKNFLSNINIKPLSPKLSGNSLSISHSRDTTAAVTVAVGDVMGASEQNIDIIKKKSIAYNLIYPINILSDIKKHINKNEINFDCNTDAINANSNPVSVLYNNAAPHNHSNTGTAVIDSDSSNLNLQNKPIINQYLKSMSFYNMRSNGVSIFYSNIIGFNFNNDTNKLIKNIYNLLAAVFKSMYCLISKPVFIITPDKIIIQLFYYLFIPNILKFKKLNKFGNKNNKNIFNRRKKLEIKKQYSKFRKINTKVRIKLRKLSNISLIKIFPEKFKILCNILNKYFKKPVEFDLIRLHYPYNDSNILVNLLGIMINKIKLRIIIRKLFEKAVIKNLKKINSKNKVNIIPAFLSGITIRVAGRLLTHRVIPRQTVKTTRRGASAKGKINFSDVARYTNKNKRGAFSITVSSGQNFF